VILNVFVIIAIIYI